MTFFIPGTKHLPARSDQFTTPCWLLISILFISFLLLQSQSIEARPATQKPYIINNKRYFPIPSAKGYSEKGIASWYGRKFHGRKTSNGEVYNMYSMTAAHKTLPMGTMLLVENLTNHKKTVVRVNDRGPFVRGRIVDLSFQAAKMLGLDKAGIARVRATALGEEAVSRGGSAGNSSPTLLYKNLYEGEFYVQIGAFSRKANGTNLQRRFTEAGHTAIIKETNRAKSPLYLVQVYVGTNMKAAKKAEKALLAVGYNGAFIIAR